MLAENHRKAAEDIEHDITILQSASHQARLMIEGAWGAAFHWIAFGCETKHQQHQNNHTRLGRFLRNQGEGTVAGWWDDLDKLRQGNWYGGAPDPADVQAALTLLGEIRLWATQ